MSRIKLACCIAGVGLLLGVAVDVAAEGAAGDAAVVQGTAHQALFAIDFDGSNGVAVGAMGELLESSDSGKSWKALDQPLTPLSLLGVTVRGDRRIAVGQKGTVLLSQNGAAWTSVQSGSDARLMSVSVNASGRAVAVGAFGTILLSADGGQSWQPVKIDWTHYLKDPVDPHLYDVIVADNGMITIVGEYGLILRSSDTKKWVSVGTGEASLFDLELRPDGVGYAVGQDGTVLTTSDGGAKWKALTTGSKAVLLGVHSTADGHVVVAGMREMLESTDAGKTWHTRTDQDFATAWYSGIAAPVQGGLIVVGHAGRIVRLSG